MIDLRNGASEPVTLDEAKAWCRIERDDEDALIAQLIASAREAAEAETGLVLVRRGFRLALDPVPPDGWVEVPRVPLVSIDAVTAYDGAGQPAAIPLHEAIVERALGVEAIRLAPPVRSSAANGVEIDVTAGLAPGMVPATIIHAMRLVVAASYELRGVVDPALQPGLVPAAARALLARHRRVRL
ncbi:hypothetical protein ASG48_02010 [Aurantimonas sp. Leaf443]|nr:hypothetical protein ASG48_02010 [Aurantimonas sp. Leaf443]